MWDLIGGVLSLAFSSVLIGWLAAAVFWGIAGAAVAGWGRLPVVIGVLVGALLPVVGTVVLAVLGGARRSNELSSSRLPTHQSLLPGAGQQPGWSAGQGWPAQQPGWSQQQGPAGWGQPAAPPPAQQSNWGTPPGWGSGGSGWPQPGGAQSGWDAASAPVPSGIPVARRPGLNRPAMLLVAMMGLVELGFVATLIPVWVQVPNYGDYGAFGVPTGIAVVLTILVLGCAQALTLRAPRRWVAVLVAWFCSWWLVIGMAAVTATHKLADLLADSTDKTTAAAATVTTNTLGAGPYLALVGAALGLLWAIASLTVVERH